jgi:hypothetical protein
MDYYEELGIPRSASTEEIRRAYKSLVRLLHPDQFQDPDLKRLAEGQMKRINEIFAVLSDPDRRRAYDQPQPPSSSASIRRREWAGWAVAAAVLLVWLAVSLSRSPAPVVTAPPPAATASQPAPPPSAPEPPSQAPVRRAQRREEKPKPAAAAIAAPAEEEEQPVLDPPPMLPVTPVVPVEAPGRPAAPMLKPKGFAGRWYYLKPRAARTAPGLYPPEYIEAVIAETAGKLRGRYHARYAVTDRAISPEVSFQFAGEGGEEAASLNWTGEGGARGEVQLRLVSRDSLEVKWFATEFGRNPGLSSGAAVLVRRQEP